MIGLKFKRACAESSRALLFSAGFMLLAACGGGGGSPGASGAGGASGTGEGATGQSCASNSCAGSMITLTDAQGPFLSYRVKISSLKLQTASGDSVETVPAPLSVDFTTLVNVTEVLSAEQIPTGEYVSATMTLDYTGAQITAPDANGNPVALSPLGANGAALTAPVVVSTTLDSSHQLVIAPGGTGLLALDFNLAASSSVNLAAGTVGVSPVLAGIATSGTGTPGTGAAGSSSQVEVCGELVNASASDFTLNVLTCNISTGGTGTVTGTGLGQMTVDVTSATTYEIDGSAFTGTAGLAALAALPANTPVTALGTFDTGSTTLSAVSVLASMSSQNNTQDEISGTVIARSGNTLTLSGTNTSASNGVDSTVLVGANTMVTEQGMTGAFTIADISVGQHIDAFGVVSTSATGATTVDSTAGQVQLDQTTLTGVVTSLAAGTVTVNLQSLDNMPVSAFTFAGTGTSATQDATGIAYVVSTGTLSQSGLVLNGPVNMSGFVTPFGTAPPDFTALLFSAVPEVLVVDWPQAGTTHAFNGLTAASTALQLVLPGAGGYQVLNIGNEAVDLGTLPAVPALVPDTTAATVNFEIIHAEQNGQFNTENYSTFAAFVAALATELTPTELVNAVSADGQLDSTSNTFKAAQIAVLVTD